MTAPRIHRTQGTELLSVLTQQGQKDIETKCSELKVDLMVCWSSRDVAGGPYTIRVLCLEVVVVLVPVLVLLLLLLCLLVWVDARHASGGVHEGEGEAAALRGLRHSQRRVGTPPALGMLRVMRLLHGFMRSRFDAHVMYDCVLACSKPSPASRPSSRLAGA